MIHKYVSEKAYDENCTAAEQCMGDNVDCTADTKKCACKAEFFADSNNNYTCTQSKLKFALINVGY